MKRIPLRVLLLTIFGLIFLTVVIALYYVPHKPFDSTFLIALFKALRNILIALAIVALAGGFGVRILGGVHPDRLANLVIQAAFGAGVSVFGILILGILGLYKPWFLWAFVIIPMIFLWKYIKEWLAGWGELGKELRRLTGILLIIAGLLGVVVLHGLLEALAPPSQYDALVYHLMLPSEFLDEGRFFFTPENPFWGMPLSAEMLNTWAMGLGSQETATVLGWMLGFLTLIGTLALGRSLSRRAGWVACAALLAGETIASSFGWGYADWGAAFMCVAALIALDAWRINNSIRFAIIAGLLAGFAFGFKYTAGIAIPAGAIMLVISRTDKSWKRSLGVYLVISIAVALLWLIKNLIFTGTILYPYIGTTPWVGAERQQFYRDTVSYLPLWKILLVPFISTLEGVEGGIGFSASIGPLMLGLLPGVFLAWRSYRESIRGFVGFILVGWLLWIVATLYNPLLGQTRLYYVFFPAWAILAGMGFEGLAEVKLANIRVVRVAGVLVILALCFSTMTIFREGIQSQPLKSIMGMEGDDAYLTRRLGAYLPAMRAIESLGSDAYVLALWEPRGLYCRPHCLPDPWIDRWYTDRRRMGDVDLILQSWHQEGFTHVLVHVKGVDFVRENDSRFTREDWDALERLLTNLELVTSFGEGYQLFRLTP